MRDSVCDSVQAVQAVLCEERCGVRDSVKSDEFPFPRLEYNQHSSQQH